VGRIFTPDISFWQTAQAIVLDLGGVPTPTNLKLLAAWSYCEKPHYAGSSWQWNNPLNTTEPCCGYTGSVNSAGVKIYPTPANGVQATVKTLQNGYYPQLVQALLTSNATQFFAASGEMTTWGTSLACIQSDYTALAEPPSEFLSAPVASAAPPVVAVSPTVPWGYLALGLTGIVLGGGALVLAVSPRSWNEFTAWEHEETHTVQQTRTINRRRY